MRYKGKHNLPIQDMGAEFAGYQYTVSGCTDKPMYKMFYNNILKLAISRYNWTGLTTDEINCIEWNLLNSGYVCAIKSVFNINNEQPDGVFFGKPTTFAETDFYGSPIEVGCIGLNSKEILPGKDNWVIGTDTLATQFKRPMTAPGISKIETLAKLLYNAFLAWQVAVETGKFSSVFTAKNKQSKNILMKTISQITENNPFLVIENSDFAENIEYINTHGSSDGASKYFENYKNTWATVLEQLGYTYSSINKHERVTSYEIINNESLADYLFNDGLMARQQFANNCNKKFGLKITVKGSDSNGMPDDISTVDRDAGAVSMEDISWNA